MVVVMSIPFKLAFSLVNLVEGTVDSVAADTPDNGGLRVRAINVLFKLTLSRANN
jgi:hypothetical protein